MTRALLAPQEQTVRPAALAQLADALEAGAPAPKVKEAKKAGSVASASSKASSSGSTKFADLTEEEKRG